MERTQLWSQDQDENRDDRRSRCAVIDDHSLQWIGMVGSLKVKLLSIRSLDPEHCEKKTYRMSESSLAMLKSELLTQ